MMQDMRVVIFWLARTELATFVRHSQWAWAVLEIVHFLGLSMLLGTVGLFDLRLAGYAKQIPPKAMTSGVSLFIWISVLVSGPMEAFFEPVPYQ
jgi:hypothetical protein